MSGRIAILCVGLTLLGASLVAVGIAEPAAWPYTALLVYACVVVGAARTPALERAEIVLLGAAAAFLHYGFSRADDVHFAPLWPLFAALVPVALAAHRASPDTLPRRALVALALIFGAVLLPVGATRDGITLHWDRLLPLPSQVRVGGEIAIGLRSAWQLGDSELALRQDDLTGSAALLFPDSDELKAVRFVARNTAADEPVFIGRQDHSRTFSGPIRAYWLLDRPLGVRHFTLDTGLNTEPRVQRDMIGDLRSRGVEWIILVENQAGDRDFQRRAYRGSDLLDRYLRDHFARVKRFGEFSVYRRSLDESQTRP